MIGTRLKPGPSQGGFGDGDTAGWTLSLLDGKPVKFSAAADPSGLSGTDTKSVVWYFTAPSTFSGNFINAYNGKLEVLDLFSDRSSCFFRCRSPCYSSMIQLHSDRSRLPIFID